MSNCCLLEIMCQGLHLCTGYGDGRLSYDQPCRNGSKWDWNGTESFRTDHAEIELPKCTKDALGKSWSKIKWNGNSRYQISENSGIPLKVFLSSGNSTKCSIRSALFNTENFWEFTLECLVEWKAPDISPCAVRRGLSICRVIISWNLTTSLAWSIIWSKYV